MAVAAARRAAAASSTALAETGVAAPKRTGGERPYNVGRTRARARLQAALASNDPEAQRGRIELAVDAVKGDFGCAELERAAASRLAELGHTVQRGSAKAAAADDTKANALDLPQFHGVGTAPEDPAGGSGYAWLRQQNAEEHRVARRAVAANTLEAIQWRGYRLGDVAVWLQHVEALLAGTRLVSPSTGDCLGALASGGATSATSLTSARGVVFDVALERVASGRRVVAVSAASAYHACGGFHTGGRHALEESMCVQSTLPASLEVAAKLAQVAGAAAPEWALPPRRRDGSAWDMHIPMDCCVFSPLVEVFRGGTNEGYPFREVAVVLEAVVSVAMPNCNDRMADSPVDAHPEAEHYAAQLESKWRAVLAAASLCSPPADCLVVPDAGCGVFRNPPEQVGAALGKVLRFEFDGRFKVPT